MDKQMTGENGFLHIQLLGIIAILFELSNKNDDNVFIYNAK